MFDETIYHLKEKLEQQKTICLDYSDEYKSLINTVIADSSFAKATSGKQTLAQESEQRNMQKVDEPANNNRQAITLKFEAISEFTTNKKKLDFADMVRNNSIIDRDTLNNKLHIESQKEEQPSKNSRHMEKIEESAVNIRNKFNEVNEFNDAKTSKTVSNIVEELKINKKLSSEITRNRDEKSFSPQNDNKTVLDTIRDSQGFLRGTIIENSKSCIFRAKSSIISLEYPSCTEMLISVYEEINEIANNISYGVWIKSQFIITINSPENKVQKIYHIFRVNSANHISLFIEKNLEEITTNSRIRIKMIFSDSESEFIRDLLKDNVVFEFKKDYYIIDFDKINDLEYTHFHYLKEENFDDLNDHFASKLIMNKQGRSSKENLLHKINSKLTIFSTENELLKHKNYSILQISLLDSDPTVKIKSRERCNSHQNLENAFYNGAFHDHTLNQHQIARRNSDAEIILEKDEAYCNLDMNIDIDENDLIMKQGFSVIIEIGMNSANVTLWKVDQDAAYSIEKILNKYLNWYSTENYYNILMLMNNQQPCFANQIEMETQQESKQREIKSDVEEFGSFSDKDIEVTFNMFNQEFLHAFKNKWEEDNKNSRWNEVNKTKLLKNFSQTIEGSENSVKDLHAISLISTMQEKHDPNDKNYYCIWKNSLNEYAKKYYPKFLMDKNK